MLNTKTLTQGEIERRLAFRCVHRHNGLRHPECYDRDRGFEPERIGYFDIESSNLSSDFGIVLVYCIKHSRGIISRKITPKELKTGVFDKRLLKELCEDLRGFDRVIGWYSSRFDIPFVRSRCIFWGHDFPKYKELHHTDAYMLAKRLLRTIHSKRLGVVSKFFNIPAKDHPLDGNVWLKCLSGNQRAIDFVETHCKEDVFALQNVCEKAIFPYMKMNKMSI